MWWLAPLLAVSSCATTSPSKQCEGEVFFVSVNCREAVASRTTATPTAEAGPSSQPSREPGAASQPSGQGEPGPASQPSNVRETPRPAPAKAAVIEAAPPSQAAPPQAAPPPSEPAKQEEPTPPQVNVIYFEPASSRVTVDARVVLDSIVEFLKAAPKEQVVLHSFVDPTGNAAVNQKLIKERSKSVRDYLVGAGVGGERIVLPADFARKVPPNFPKDQFWSLRKVAVDYSQQALQMAQAQAEADDREAERDAKPERRPQPKHEAPGEANSSKESKLDRVDILYWKSVNHALFILAKQLGYFEEEGLDVRLHNSSRMEASQLSLALAESNQIIGKSAGAVETREFMKNKKYFMGAVCPYGLHEELAKNVPLVQIGSLLQEPITLVLKRDLADKLKHDLNAFAGHSVGRARVDNSAIDYMELFTSVLTQRHIKFETKWIKNRAELEDSLLRGDFDAMVSTPPYDQLLLERDPTMGIFELRSLYPHISCCRQVVMRDQLRDKKMRDKYVRFERAVIRAHKFYKEHLLEACDVVAKVLQMSPSVVRKIYLRPGYSLDPNPNTKGSLAFYDTIKESVGKQDFREALDTSIYEEALFALAKASPDEEYFKRAVRDYRLTN
jgi:outer membrane protein OmpA-like peptidoglycan-associated protein